MDTRSAPRSEIWQRRGNYGRDHGGLQATRQPSCRDWLPSPTAAHQPEILADDQVDDEAGEVVGRPGAAAAGIERCLDLEPVATLGPMTLLGSSPLVTRLSRSTRRQAVNIAFDHEY